MVTTEVLEFCAYESQKSCMLPSNIHPLRSRLFSSFFLESEFRESEFREIELFFNIW